MKAAKYKQLCSSTPQQTVCSFVIIHNKITKCMKNYQTLSPPQLSCHVAMLPCCPPYLCTLVLEKPSTDLVGGRPGERHLPSFSRDVVSCLMSSTGSTSLLQFASKKKNQNFKIYILLFQIFNNIEIYFEDNGQLIQQIYVVDSSRSVKYFAELICLLAA